MKGFTVDLVAKYKGEYYGSTDMQITIPQFGNGEVLGDGTIADAKGILPLTSDMDKVKQASEGLEHLNGCTNTTQAFTVAEKLLFLGGRRRRSPPS